MAAEPGLRARTRGTYELPEDTLAPPCRLLGRLPCNSPGIFHGQHSFRSSVRPSSGVSPVFPPLPCLMNWRLVHRQSPLSLGEASANHAAIYPRKAVRRDRRIRLPPVRSLAPPGSWPAASRRRAACRTQAGVAGTNPRPPSAAIGTSSAGVEGRPPCRPGSSVADRVSAYDLADTCLHRVRRQPVRVRTQTGGRQAEVRPPSHEAVVVRGGSASASGVFRGASP